jgi:hypothetical protein
MIRNKVHGKNILISIDETCNTGAHYVANIVIGTLETDGTGEAFLLMSDMLESVNYSTICKLFLTVLCFYCGNRAHNVTISLFL